MASLLEQNFVDYSHIEAFRQALQAEDIISDNAEDHDIPSPNLSSGNGAQNIGTSSVRVRKVSALSDFAPVNLRIKRRNKRNPKSKRHHKRNDLLFLLLRWPILILIFLFILVQFGLYVLIRQLVNGKEWISAWRGKKGALRKKLRASTTYEEWKKTALQLDDYLRFEDWKDTKEDIFYDWKLVSKVKRSLVNFRSAGDARGLLGVLETCVKSNFAATETPRLYSETYFGTKNLIEAYLDELELALDYVRTTPDLTNEEKRRFFRSANTNLGTSALCLSGGASFGYYHIGVVKAFVDANMLPRVITGTSAGGLIAALVCTRTDEELKQLLNPALADRITPCEEPFSVWIRRFWATGARFDAVQWAEKSSWFTRGSLTFKEAYMRTGRVLNVSCIPADKHSPTKLLNYLTAPNTVIWSSLLASAAVPGILNPVVLMEKLPDGSIVPWNWGSRFKDGSLRVDIPLQALNLYFNVTHPIVSQVNPHVHLFFFAPRGSAGKPVAHWLGKGWVSHYLIAKEVALNVFQRGNFLLSAGEQWLKHELTKNFKIIRDLELLPELLGQDWSSVFLQRFSGSVTIWPRTRFWDWFRLLTDPDREELKRMIGAGQLVTWPKLHIIENRLRIERKISAGRQAVRMAMQSKQTRSTSKGESSMVGTDMTAIDAEGEEEATLDEVVPRTTLLPSDAPPYELHEPNRSPPLRTKWKSPFEESHPPKPSRLMHHLRASSFPSLALSSFTSNSQPMHTNPTVEIDPWSSESDPSSAENIVLAGSDRDDSSFSSDEELTPVNISKAF